MCHHVDGVYGELYAELRADADDATADADPADASDEPPTVDLSEPPIGQFELVTTDLQEPTLTDGE